MFGLESDNGGKNKQFEFDLEKDLKTDPNYKKKLSKDIESKILELKNLLRKGLESDEEFEQHGILLRGYAALQKVVNRIGK